MLRFHFGRNKCFLFETDTAYFPAVFLSANETKKKKNNQANCSKIQKHPFQSIAIIAQKKEMNMTLVNECIFILVLHRCLAHGMHSSFELDVKVQ